MKLFIENLVCSTKETIKGIFCLGKHDYKGVGFSKGKVTILRCSKCGKILNNKT